MGFEAAETGADAANGPQNRREDSRTRGGIAAWQSRFLAAQSVAAKTAGLWARAAAAIHTKDCLPAKDFLDVLDGRTTWRGRETLEQHLRTCWHCVDHFSRLAEVVELIRGVEPLTVAEAEPFQKLLGVAPEKKSFWKRR